MEINSVQWINHFKWDIKQKSSAKKLKEKYFSCDISEHYVKECQKQKMFTAAAKYYNRLS